jgi:hypothetical protein
VQLIVALLLALTIPVGQLRTISVETSCCCPDPARCHCPDHGKSPIDQPQLRACHRTTQTHIAPTLPAFSAPAQAVTDLPAADAPLPVLALSTPHAAPPRPRPDAPS